MAKTKQQFNKEYYARHKERILAERKLDRSINEQKQYKTTKKYNTRYYESRTRYRRSPKGIESTRNRIQRWIDNHPFAPEWTLDRLEYFMAATERNKSLDMERAETKVTLYELVSGMKGL